MISDQAPAFSALATTFTAALQQKGVTPALQQSFKAGVEDFAPLARQIVDAGAGGSMEWSLRFILAKRVFGIWQSMQFPPGVPAL